MTDRYQKGRRDALEAMGVRSKVTDNHLVSGFVGALEDNAAGRNPSEAGGNRPLHRQSWGKTVDYSTSNQIFNGGGTRS